MTVEQLLSFLDRVAPFDSAEEFDFCGLQCGSLTDPVTRIGVCLDAVTSTVEQAIRLGCSTLVSHHPLTLEPPRGLCEQTSYGRLVRSMTRAGISHIAVHTNWDKAEGGVDDCFAALLGMHNPASLRDGIGRLAPVSAFSSVKEMAAVLAAQLHAPLRYADAGKTPFLIASVCGGGKAYVADAVRAGADTFVTGDISYHVWLEAAEMGINLIDAGHFSSELAGVNALAALLREAFSEVEVLQLEQAPPFFSV